jgi:hypothetical protein
MDNTDSKIKENIRVFVKHMLANTVNLVRVDEQMSPVSLCSGGLVQKGQNVFVISAYHGLKKGRYCLETNLVLEGSAQTVLLPLNGVFNTERLILKPGTLEVEHREEIDFGWCRLDLESARTQMKSDPLLKGRKIELPIYNGPLLDRPERDRPYGYAAWNRVLIVDGYARFLERSPSYEVCLAYDGVDSDTGLYRFELARKHKGYEYYKGASGAPIADETRKIVSLVIAGREKENLLLGLPLADYARLIELE